jgi:hypothetical protein
VHLDVAVPGRGVLLGGGQIAGLQRDQGRGVAGPGAQRRRAGRARRGGLVQAACGRGRVTASRRQMGRVDPGVPGPRQPGRRGQLIPDVLERPLRAAAALARGGAGRHLDPAGQHGPGWPALPDERSPGPDRDVPGLAGRSAGQLDPGRQQLSLPEQRGELPGLGRLDRLAHGRARLRQEAGGQQQLGPVELGDSRRADVAQLLAGQVVVVQRGGDVVRLGGEETEIVLGLRDGGDQVQPGEYPRGLLQVRAGLRQLAVISAQDAPVDQGPALPQRVTMAPERAQRALVAGQRVVVAAHPAQDQRALHRRPGQAQPGQPRAGPVYLAQRGGRVPEIIQDERVAHPGLRLDHGRARPLGDADGLLQAGGRGGRVVQYVGGQAQGTLRAGLAGQVAAGSGLGQRPGGDGLRPARIGHDLLQEPLAPQLPAPQLPGLQCPASRLPGLR